jgi:hypothetical protein
MMKKKNILRSILIPLIILAGITCKAQDVSSMLNDYFKEVRAGRNPTSSSLLQADKAESTLSNLSTYMKDTVPTVRATAYSLSQQIGFRSENNLVRQKAVMQLVVGCGDKESGNVGSVLNHLTSFRKIDFSNEALDSIRSLVKRKPYYFHQAIKLAGFLNLVDLKEYIRPFTKPGNTQQVRWAAIVSLARMGDEAAITDMMSRIGKFKIKDDVVYELFPDLIYTRQRQAIDYMVQALNSDEKNCESADAENASMIPCAYRIMEQLAKAVNNYPLKLDASGDVETKDYEKALRTVRKWFSEEGKNYTVTNEIY